MPAKTVDLWSDWDNIGRFVYQSWSEERRAAYWISEGEDPRAVAVQFPRWGAEQGFDVERLERVCPQCGNDPAGDPRPALRLVETSPDPSTLDSWREWCSWLRAQERGDRTAPSYGRLVLRFLAETGCRPPRDYLERDVVSFLGTFAPRGAAKHEHLKALRSFFAWCVRNGVADHDPAGAVPAKKPRRVAPVTLTEEELTRLLVAAVSELGERPAWALLLTFALGLRRIEAAGLKWEHVRQGETGPVVEIRQTKGANERDPLPLSPLALECLARLRELPAPPQAIVGPEYVLRVRRATLSRWAHVAGVAAGLPARKIGSHRLRATLATQLLRAGVDIRTIQRTLGHLRLDSTSFYLAEGDERAVRDALDRIR
jgi:integrase/recombinase XerD